MNSIYVGIDPSINSTGICIKYKDIIEFYIIKGGMHLTKKEINASDSLSNFNYICYDKLAANNDNHINEYNKTKNFISIIEIIKDILHKKILCDNSLNINNIYIVMEGISYGSASRTKAIFDLAGLNYIIRYALTKYGYNIIICTPSEIKKFATGNGNCKKDIIENIFLTVFPEYKILPKIDDIADAYMMMLYGEKYQ